MAKNDKNAETDSEKKIPTSNPKLESLDEVNEFAENIIDTVHEPLLALDKELRVVKASRSFYDFFKVNPGETIGTLIYDLGDQQWNIPQLRELLETILPEKTTFDNYEVEHEFPAIGKRIMLLNARQILRAWGKEKIILLAMEDITDRRFAEQGERGVMIQQIEHRSALLEAANKELEAFTYSVSHDLRAPLRHISGYVQLLTNRFHSLLSDKGKHYLDSIADSVYQMRLLIDNLLQFSRSGRVEMQRSNSDMNEIVRDVIEFLSQENPDRDIQWSVAKLPSLFCDSSMMGIVWMNLLSNAIKFSQTREKSLIEIGVKVEDKEVIFFVKDNGVGFDMQYAHKLFEVFQRLHSIEDFEGTGIGLANVRRVIMRHGGRTWAESEPDKGATFYFSLPNI
ncbi:MAG: ATP-binding protein [Ignavibacteriaceae bacterium]